MNAKPVISFDTQTENRIRAFFLIECPK